MLRKCSNEAESSPLRLKIILILTAKMFRNFISCVTLYLVTTAEALDNLPYQSIYDSYHVKSEHASNFVSEWNKESKLEPASVDVNSLIEHIVTERVWLVHLTLYKNIIFHSTQQPIILRSLTPVAVYPVNKHDEFEQGIEM